MTDQPSFIFYFLFISLCKRQIHTCVLIKSRKKRRWGAWDSKPSRLMKGPYESPEFAWSNLPKEFKESYQPTASTYVLSAYSSKIWLQSSILWSKVAGLPLLISNIGQWSISKSRIGSQAVWPDKNRQMSIKVAQKWCH